ncbi:MAG: hypothetical protein HQL13_02670 [Candidatus Omnitrophica bacterium]|nr:hypothetical protein [Candidatus Omnitrophota bacterium]
MNKKAHFFLLGILLLEYLFIFTFLLNYDLSWMNSEKFGVRQWMLSNGPQWKSEDWTRFLNINVIECNPYRLSRPLSNFVELVDSKWRACLWDKRTPHPSVSIQWPFMFILLPWLLYLTFVNMGIKRAVALTGVCVYVATAGFLGPLVMLFHPSKNLANFFAVLSMFFFSLGYKQKLAQKRINGLVIMAGFTALFTGFFSDETGLYLYVMGLLLFYRVWKQLWDEKRWALLSGLLLLPLFYFLTIKFFLPYLHQLVRGVQIHLNEYESFPSVTTLFWPDWHFFWQNAQFLFADHPHLMINYPQLCAYPVLFIIQMVYVLAVLFLMFLFFKAVRESSPEEKNFLKLSGMGILLMIGFCFFQTFQVSKNVKAWGVWWYGSLFSIIYVFPLVFFLQFVFSHYKNLKKWIILFACIFALNAMTFTLYRLAIFKYQNLNRAAYSFMGIFKGTVDPYQSYSFRRSFERNDCKKMYAHLTWLKWKHLPEDVDPKQKDKCFSGVLASDFYFMTEENGYLPAEFIAK